MPRNLVVDLDAILGNMIRRILFEALVGGKTVYTLLENVRALVQEAWTDTESHLRRYSRTAGFEGIPS